MHHEVWHYNLNLERFSTFFEHQLHLIRIALLSILKIHQIFKFFSKYCKIFTATILEDMLLDFLKVNIKIIFIDTYKMKFEKIIVDSTSKGYKSLDFTWHWSFGNCKLIILDFGGLYWLLDYVKFYIFLYKTPKDLQKFEPYNCIIDSFNSHTCLNSNSNPNFYGLGLWN